MKCFEKLVRTATEQLTDILSSLKTGPSVKAVAKEAKLTYQEKIGLAFTLSMRAHEGQRRRTGEPFFMHPVRVAMNFMGDPQLIILALLHDVVEESEYTVHDVKTIVGLDDQLTNALDCITLREEEEDYLEDYIPRVMSNPLSRKVKIFDIYDNLSHEPKKARIPTYLSALRLLRDQKRGARIVGNLPKD